MSKTLKRNLQIHRIAGHLNYNGQMYTICKLHKSAAKWFYNPYNIFYKVGDRILMNIDGKSTLGTVADMSDICKILSPYRHKYTYQNYVNDFRQLVVQLDNDSIIIIKSDDNRITGKIFGNNEKPYTIDLNTWNNRFKNI